MSIRFLTSEEHRQVLKQLVSLGKSANGTRYHNAGSEYTSLMICFLLHNLTSAESLLRLQRDFTDDWFPVTVGYTIVRPMFEIDVTSHYISQSPNERSRQYIEFGHVLNKREMDACAKHMNSNESSWREGMDITWKHKWAVREIEINDKYKSIRASFEKTDRKGKLHPFTNWSGKSIHEMAISVDHKEAYDIFYAELSSFSHADIRLANRFLQVSPDGLSWSQRSDEGDVGNVFRFASIFLDCFLKLFAEQFNCWDEIDVEKCWEIKNNL